jgi:glucose-6-phosphate isomerase
MANVHMRDLFAADPARFEHFSLRFNDILLDYSKNRINADTLRLLRGLAEQAELPRWIEAMFRGEKINHTEGRAVLHVALRNLSDEPVLLDRVDVMPLVRAEQDRMATLSEAIRSGRWRGATGQAITDIVNIGIGGSDLGPEMVCEALRPYGRRELRVHFVSNVDENMVLDTLAGLEPASTLFIVASKTFTTQETMTNARTARRWVLEKIGDEAQLHKHFVAVSANIEAAKQFGIRAENIFAMWDWVGGRYSLWSSIGLSIALYIGMDRFRELLRGAWEMDRHFRSAPLAENLPVTLGLLGVWYNNFFGCETHAVLPYEQHLRRLPAYLQQADMESNGKAVDRDGRVVDYQTGPVLFGEIGINAQHAFYQLLHQGTRLVPADMLAAVNAWQSLPEHRRILMSNIFAQTEALMKGKTEAEARAELEQAGLKGEALERLLPYKIFPGNRPTNTILFDTLDPQTLGSLIALYEHKIFVQGVIWNINSFDQWGVELGKQLAAKIQPELAGDVPVTSHDSSTNGLINYYKKLRREGTSDE